MPISLPGPTFKKGDLVYYQGREMGDARRELWEIVARLGTDYKIQNLAMDNRINLKTVPGKQLIKANIGTPPRSPRDASDMPSPSRMGKTRRRRKNKSKKSRPKSIKSKGKRKGKGKRKKTRR
tara:strand:- start:99 stop:467 length:369 start_codon:yes stop_codon:yes gene_type:complete